MCEENTAGDKEERNKKALYESEPNSMDNQARKNDRNKMCRNAVTIQVGLIVGEDRRGTDVHGALIL